jgi:UDP-glucose 4-epimerase
MRILVTGGAGFIGGHVAEEFLEEGHDVVVLDAMDPYYALGIKEHTIEQCRSLAGAPATGTYEFVSGDVRDADLVTRLVDGADAVYHLAGRAGVRDSVAEPRVYDEVNVDGTLNVLDAARNTDIERVVMASSSSVYGGRAAYLPFAETDPTLPVSPYGASKLAAERYLCSYSEVYDLPAVALRYFTVYGPRMRPNMAISNFVSRCLNGSPPVVNGDGEQTRDFTFVEDVVAANVAVLETSRADGEAVNVGSGERISIGALAAHVRDRLAPDLDVRYGDRHAADADHTHADVSKAGRLLGYEPSRTIEAGIEEFVEWYRENRTWYEPLVLDS